MFVDTTSPRNTSKQCNECGFTHDENRQAGQFECQSCRKSNHADYNATKSVAELSLQRGHQPSGRRSVIVIIAIAFVTTSREQRVRGLKHSECDSPAVKSRNNHYQSIRSEVRNEDTELARDTGSPVLGVEVEFTDKPRATVRGVVDECDVHRDERNREPKPSRDLTDIPADLDEVLLRAMAKQPEDRYEGVVFMHEDLREVFDAY